MNTTAITKLKRYRAHAKAFSELIDNHKKKIAEPNCDKHALKFNADGSFAAFTATVSLDNHYGYYGNSSCHTNGNYDKEITRDAFLHALNQHKAEIFKTMAEYFNKRANDISQEAQKEIDVIQSFLREYTTNQ